MQILSIVCVTMAYLQELVKCLPIFDQGNVNVFFGFINDHPLNKNFEFMKKSQGVLLFDKTKGAFKYGVSLMAISALIMPSGFLWAAANPGSNDSYTDQANKQQITVTGHVKDQYGLPLQGVSVQIKGTNKGAITGISGEFTITVPGPEAILVFTSIGKQTEEIKVGDQTDITVQMEEGAGNLDEVVVVAFGKQQKDLITSSIAVVDNKVMQDRPVPNLTSGLQGQVPGLNIVSNSGQPGETPSINIRGAGSLKSETNPLVIIDGIPGSLSMINPNDVASVSVLKDASASSLYGARAANGVILITTKQAKVGKANINYSGYVGVENPTELFKEAGAYNYANAYNTALMMDAISRNNPEMDPSKKVFTDEELAAWKSGQVPSTDWRDALFSENGFTQSHNLNISGGLSNENIAVRNNLSLGYFQEKGNVVHTDYDRVTLRDNAGIDMGRFGIDLGLALTYTNQKEPTSATVGDLWAITSAINRQRPVDLIKDENGDWVITATNDTRNPVRQAQEGGLYQKKIYNVIANLKLHYDITKDLVLNFTNSVNYLSTNTDQFKNTLEWSNGTTTGPNSSTKESFSTMHYMQQLDLNYDKHFGDHHLKVIVGGQQEYEKYKYLSAFRRDFVNNSSGSLQLGGSDGQDNSSVDWDWGLMGAFARINYDYKSRYLLELNAREDGSSRLTPSAHWDFFPSASAGWRISQEEFFAPLRHIFSELKLRGSYGVLGNQNIVGAVDDDNNAKYYPYQAIVGATVDPAYWGQLYYVFGGNLITPMSVVQDPNNTFTWERTAITDIALEGAMFNNLVNFSLGYYNKTTRGMLMTKTVSAVNGGKDYVANIGKMRNAGIELSLGLNKMNPAGFSYSLNGNLSYSTNKLLDLGGVELAPGSTTAQMAGHPNNAYYLYEADGLITKEEFLDPDFALINGQTYGDQKIVDQNGDGKIDNSDRVLIDKNSTPKWLYGLNFDFAYHNFGIAGMLQGAAGGWLYLGSSTGYGFSSGYGITNWTIENSYDPINHPENYNTRLPRVSVANSVNATYPSTTFLFNASYVRLKNLRVYYSLPDSFLKKISMRSARLYVSGQNLYTWSKLPRDLGIDPEVASPTAGYPLLKTYSFGIDVTF